MEWSNATFFWVGFATGFLFVIVGAWIITLRSKWDVDLKPKTP